ncbi:hypothetical protein DZB84_18425 [Bacillus sp. HNG]|uniref:hypothetical protein n=1 Tax=Bacillus sp. HNG TaxID=2293325 RepID=UPI000E2FE213|nr:hypothetical protein [Bacillus sp. HNG]RFB12727.1 hypothetical protein DZB84_18425 [Bacillus sp. HNG]
MKIFQNTIILSLIIPGLFFIGLQVAWIVSGVFLVLLSDYQFVLSREIVQYINELFLPNFQWIKFLFGYIFMFIILLKILKYPRKYLKCILITIIGSLWFFVFLSDFTYENSSPFIAKFSYILSILAICYSAYNNILTYVDIKIIRVLLYVIIGTFTFIFLHAYFNGTIYIFTFKVTPLNSDLLTIIATILLIFEIYLKHTNTKTYIFQERKCIRQCTKKHKKVLHKVLYLTPNKEKSIIVSTICKKCGYKHNITSL